MLDQKVVLVTGASSGIGRAIALRCGRDGADLAITYRSNQAGAETTAGEIRSYGRRAEVIRTDISRREDIDGLVKQLKALYGRVDVWINNAGRGITRSVLDLTDTDFDEMMAVNVKSALYGMQAIAPHFMARGTGHIINVSSMLSRVPTATFRTAYSAAGTRPSIDDTFTICPAWRSLKCGSTSCIP